MILDDADQIRSVDKGDMIARIMGLSTQISDTLRAMGSIDIPKALSGCKEIVVVGMGGSGIPGDFLGTMYNRECSVPIFVHKDYGLPAFVDDDSLVFAISYTGTTEETLDAFDEALERGAKVFGISGGDRLLSRFDDNGIPHFSPPPGKTSRESLGYLLFAMVSVLERLAYIPGQISNIRATVTLLERLSAAYAPESMSSDNEAKTIAYKLYQKVPVVYCSSVLNDAAGLRWKQQLNENSKTFAQLEIFPDVTHNQLAAMARPSDFEKELCAVFLRSKGERPELSRRIEAATEIIASKGVPLHEHWAEGTTLMENLLSQSYLGDFVSAYLAVLNRVDAVPTATMSELKRMLGLKDLSPRSSP